MFYFYVDKIRKAEKGVPQDRFTRKRLYRTHAKAQDDGRGAVIVVDTRKMDALPTEADALPKKALVNVRPYLPTKEIVAGGGVLTKMGKTKLKVLLIFRKGRWDLPKGKLDPGETVKQCAKREVCEELGIDAVKVVQFLDTTVHGYAEDDHFMVKTTYWYHMTTKATSFVPQLEEKITAVKWMSIDKARRKLGHATLIHLLDRVEAKLMQNP